MQFEDNSLVPLLFGEHNSHLRHIQNALDIDISSRGNEVVISGPEHATQTAKAALDMLWDRVQKDQNVSIGDIDAAIRFAGEEGRDSPVFDRKLTIRGQGTKIISPRTPNQAAYIEALKNRDMVFGIGPAGTGKTYLAVAAAVELYRDGLVSRMVFCRPAVEAGEQLGFLPGDMLEKIDPYLRPIYDALHDVMPADQIARKMAGGDIEIAPLAFMRGRTLKNAFVVLDEAQNTTAMQMKMFLTRMGEDTRMVINGDPSQIDLPKGSVSGLNEAIDILTPVKDISFIHFDEGDVVRHKLVGRIVEAYERYKK